MAFFRVFPEWICCLLFLMILCCSCTFMQKPIAVYFAIPITITTHSRDPLNGKVSPETYYFCTDLLTWCYNTSMRQILSIHLALWCKRRIRVLQFDIWYDPYQLCLLSRNSRLREFIWRMDDVLDVLMMCSVASKNLGTFWRLWQGHIVLMIGC